MLTIMSCQATCNITNAFMGTWQESSNAVLIALRALASEVMVIYVDFKLLYCVTSSQKSFYDGLSTTNSGWLLCMPG